MNYSRKTVNGSSFICEIIWKNVKKRKRVKNGESMFRQYIKLLRVKHYIKNLLIFVPLFFSGCLFDMQCFSRGLEGFVAFCLISSAIYILNDYRDIEKDRKHPVKKNRPLASGKISKRRGGVTLCVCVVVALGVCVHTRNIRASICLMIYLVLNIVYSMGLKNVPIIDVIILASGFVLRVFFGGFITNIEISKWLYLVVTTGSLYMGLGKRRNELKKQLDTRDVLKKYNFPFLDKNMYVCVAMANVFYALWTIEMPDSRLVWTTPFFMIMLMCYSLDTEGDSDADPVEVILHDKILIAIIICYTICILGILYIF